jgi:DNA-(apurinic or apyrimidinic site) lyase
VNLEERKRGEKPGMKDDCLVIPPKVFSFFTAIPYQSWDLIVRNEPEWIEFNRFHKEFPFGPFAVLMLICGLNAYQLKGRAEHGYFPAYRNSIQQNRIPETPGDLVQILLPLYECDRLPKGKCSRLYRFMESNLASQVWNSSPVEIEETFIEIWHDLAQVMRQHEDKKTIVFAMKCLGIALLMEHKVNFHFEEIPIPVDSRVRKITGKMGGPTQPDDLVREYWHQVIQKVRQKDSTVTMIHLDSFLWQVVGYSGEERKDWFCKNGICFLRDSFEEIIGGE